MLEEILMGGERMRIKGKVKGVLLGQKTTKKGKLYFEVYDGRDIIRVFSSGDFDNLDIGNVGNEVELGVIVVTDSAFVMLDE